MIGGQGEKKTLRLMAEHAEMAELHLRVDELARKLEVLARPLRDRGPRHQHDQQDRAGTVVVAPTTTEAEDLRNGFLRGRGLDWDALDAATRELVGARLVVGDADTAGERVQQLVGLGLDGLTFNMPANGHDPDAVGHTVWCDQGGDRSSGCSQGPRSVRGRGRAGGRASSPGCRSRTRPSSWNSSRRRLTRAWAMVVSIGMAASPSRISTCRLSNSNPGSACHCERPDSWRMKPRMNVASASEATGMSSSAMPTCWSSCTPSWTMAGAPCWGRGRLATTGARFGCSSSTMRR